MERTLSRSACRQSAGRSPNDACEAGTPSCVIPPGIDSNTSHRGVTPSRKRRSTRTRFPRGPALRWLSLNTMTSRPSGLHSGGSCPGRNPSPMRELPTTISRSEPGRSARRASSNSRRAIASRSNARGRNTSIPTTTAICRNTYQPIVQTIAARALRERLRADIGPSELEVDEHLAVHRREHERQEEHAGVCEPSYWRRESIRKGGTRPPRPDHMTGRHDRGNGPERDDGDRAALAARRREQPTQERER